MSESVRRAGIAICGTAILVFGVTQGDVKLLTIAVITFLYLRDTK